MWSVLLGLAVVESLVERHVVLRKRDLVKTLLKGKGVEAGSKVTDWFQRRLQREHQPDLEGRLIDVD